MARARAWVCQYYCCLSNLKHRIAIRLHHVASELDPGVTCLEAFLLAATAPRRFINVVSLSGVGGMSGKSFNQPNRGFRFSFRSLAERHKTWGISGHYCFENVWKLEIVNGLECLGDDVIR